MRATGGEGIPITSCPYFYGHPAFSPDGPAAGPFTYNVSIDRYMKVWSTEKSMAGSCYAVVLSLRDGTRHEAHFLVAK